MLGMNGRNITRNLVFNSLRQQNKLILIENFTFASKLNVRKIKQERYKDEEKNNEMKKQLKALKDKYKFEQQAVQDTNSGNKESNNNKVYQSPIEALKAIRKTDASKPNEVLNLVISLGVDLKKSDQVVRGIARLPGGIVRSPRICVFTSGHLQEIAKNAGADLIGNEQVIEDIKLGICRFKKIVCTLDMLPQLKALGRILGPKGLMPNLKVGTVTTGENLENLIRDLKREAIEYRMEDRGQIHMAIGRRNFTDENILINIDSLIKSLLEKKAENFKNKFFVRAYLRGATGESYRIDVKSFDTKSNGYFMKNFI